jgi:hypothetical protein
MVPSFSLETTAFAVMLAFVALVSILLITGGKFPFPISPISTCPLSLTMISTV